jgi:predicted SprT family Zn-dependent metalloprotease
MNALAKPTEQAYEELQLAYDWFNQRLFEGVLPPCLITFQRNKRTMGYFCRDRFVDQSGKKTDEIAMNPEYFAVISLDELLSTLVHEMTHLWQDHFGKPGRGSYHNQEWANKMLAIGLCPSDTGRPGGKQTGDQMMDYVVENGRFSQECRALVGTEFKISWYDRYPVAMRTLQPIGNSFSEAQVHYVSADADRDQVAAQAGYVGAIPALSNPKLALVPRVENASNRVKFVCGQCDAQAWGKPSLNLVCGDCGQPMLSK